MNTEEKIKKAQKLNELKNRLVNFIKLLESSQKATGKKKDSGEINNLRFIKISANICTGSDSPSYSEELYGDTHLNNVVAELLIPRLKERVKYYDEKVNEIIK